MTEYEEYESKERIRAYNEKQIADRNIVAPKSRPYKVLDDPRSEEFKANVTKRVGKHSLRGFLNSDVNITYEDVADLYEQQEGCCFGCFVSFSEVPFEIDHKVALTMMGKNSPDNVQLLCKPCNITKKDHDYYKWLSYIRTKQVKNYLIELAEAGY